MKKKIIVLDANGKQCRELCAMIEAQHYPTAPVQSISDLKRHFETEDCLGVFIDIDTVSVTNRDLRELTISYPGIYFFCLSAHRFHPELKDAICYHIFACLNRPIDPDELFYWLRSIYQDDQDDKNPKDVSED